MALILVCLDGTFAFQTLSFRLLSTYMDQGIWSGLIKFAHIKIYDRRIRKASESLNEKTERSVNSKICVLNYKREKI